MGTVGHTGEAFCFPMRALSCSHLIIPLHVPRHADLAHQCGATALIAVIARPELLAVVCLAEIDLGAGPRISAGVTLGPDIDSLRACARCRAVAVAAAVDLTVDRTGNQHQGGEEKRAHRRSVGKLLAD